jgi:peptidoglycan/LPS O-acetylase OafA/YrhL
LYHFVLQALFISDGASFNGPTWSISIEILLYIIFFAFCKYKFNSTKGILFFILVGLLIFQFSGLNIGRGIFSFFIGGLVFYVFKYVQVIDENKNLYKYLVFVLVISTLMFLIEYRTNTLLNVLLSKFSSYFSIHGKNHTKFIYYMSVDYFIRAFLFPLTILVLVSCELKRGYLGKRFSVLGDITYSSYLLHFPLQLIFIICTTCLKLDKNIYDKSNTLIVFFIILIIISIISFNYIEMPLQKILRKKSSKKKELVA